MLGRTRRFANLIATRLFAALLLSMTASAAFAQTAPPAQAPGQPPPSPPPGPFKAVAIAIVDMQYIERETSAAKGIRSEIDRQLKTYQAEFQKKEGELRSTDQELQKQQSVLSADAFNEKRQAFGQKVNTYQNDVQIKRKQLDAGYGQALEKARGALVEVVRELAVERKANLVMYRAQLILFDTSYDASDEALKRLDVKLSSVTVTIPKPSEVTAPPAGQNAAAQPAAAPAAAPAQAAKKK